MAINRNRGFDVGDNGINLDGGHLSSGSAVPTHTADDGDRYFRTGTGNEDLYVRESGAWVLKTFGGGSSITVEDEGTPLTTAVTKFNFVGTGVTVTEPVTDEMLVTISSGGSSQWTDGGGFLRPNSHGDSARTYGSGGVKYLEVKHDDTNGLLNSSSGDIKLNSAANVVIADNSEKITIGTSTPIARSHISIDSVYTGNTAGNEFQRKSLATVTPTSNWSGVYELFRADLSSTHGVGVSVGGLTGVDCQPRHDGAGTVTSISGGVFGAYANGTGAVQDVTGVNCAAGQLSTGVATNVIGLNATITQFGTINKAIRTFIQAGTDRWSYYGQGTAQNYMEGSLGLGVAVPNEKLEVDGNIRMNGSTSGYVGFKPAAAAGSVMYELPAADGSSGDVLQTNASGVLSWLTPSAGSTPADTLVSSATPTSTTSASYVVLNTMTSTPASGNYRVSFSASGWGSNQSPSLEYAIHVGGTIVGHTYRSMDFASGAQGDDLHEAMHTQDTNVTVNGSQAIDVRYRTNSGTFNVGARSMIITKVT